ncbi:MAG TPA: ZIP family metal transporter [Burkholderiales bacterium]
MVLLSIIAATLAGGLLSVLAAALISFAVLERWVPRLVSFAVGALLAVALLVLLPQAIESQADARGVFATLLAGLLAFFMMEKLALWRHSHVHGAGDGHGAHGHAHGAPVGGRATAAMIVIGDSLHNFVDGVLIAAAFLADPKLGWAAAIAVIAHEIPQEVGDFLVLRASGYTRARALALNALSGLASVVGGVLAYFLLSSLAGAIPYVLALAAAGFLYVAVADLIPNLHRRVAVRDAASQLALIALGVATVVATGHTH